MVRVLGIDVCRGRVVACLLDELPSDAHEVYQDYEFLEFPLNQNGLEALLALKPDEVIYEPTGIAYSKVWVERLKRAGILTRAVDHAKLRAYRKGLGLPDKDDEADSLALTCYRLDPTKQGRAAYIRERDEVTQEVRRLSLRLQHIDRRKSPIICRLKQDLEIAFPEQASKSCDDSPLFWGWLAGERKSTRYDRMLANSVGLGIYPEIRTEAKALLQCFSEEREVEQRLEHLVTTHDEFKPYVKVLLSYGFGLRSACILMTQIYPITDFLKDGRIEVKMRKSRKTGKTNARHLSLRRFQKAIGVAPTREDSGSVKKKRASGSSLCRKTLWIWQFSRVENANVKTSNAVILHYREMYQSILQRFSTVDVRHLIDPKDWNNENKPKGVRLKLARAYLRRKVSIGLFYDLVEAVKEVNS